MNRQITKAMTGILTFFFICLSVSATAVQANIASIDNISKTVYKGAGFSLPQKVKAKLKNNSIVSVSVKWNVAKVDTGKTGTTTISGTVAGYRPKVLLTLRIVNRPLGIAYVRNINAVIYENETYDLPGSVQATMLNNATASLKVTWKPGKADTSVPGEYVFLGSIHGYQEKVQLRLMVIPHSIKINSDDVDKIVAYSRDPGFTGNNKPLAGEMKLKVIQWINNAEVLGPNDLPPECPAPQALLKIFLKNGRSMAVYYYGDIYTDLCKLYQIELHDYFSKIAPER